MARKTPTLIGFDPAQKAGLDRLSRVTNRSLADLVREATDDLLKKHAKLLKTGGAK